VIVYQVVILNDELLQCLDLTISGGNLSSVHISGVHLSTLVQDSFDEFVRSAGILRKVHSYSYGDIRSNVIKQILLYSNFISTLRHATGSKHVLVDTSQLVSPLATDVSATCATLPLNVLRCPELTIYELTITGTYSERVTPLCIPAIIFIALSKACCIYRKEMCVILTTDSWFNN
jgi:hypothetical protein